MDSETIKYLLWLKRHEKRLNAVPAVFGVLLQIPPLVIVCYLGIPFEWFLYPFIFVVMTFGFRLMGDFIQRDKLIKEAEALAAKLSQPEGGAA